MKIALIGNAGSVHMVKFANAFAARGHSVTLFSAAEAQDAPRETSERVHTVYLPGRRPFVYYQNALSLRRMLLKGDFDVVNAHFATGYGTLARLAGVRPLLLSVWGSDVYVVPHESRFKHDTVLRNLRFADALASTSRVMAEETRRLLGEPEREIFVTPFGVDLKRFRPQKCTRQDGKIHIGIVKLLEPEYGHATLLRAFSLLRARCGETVPLQLDIVGDGSLRPMLTQLAAELGLGETVTFHGMVPNERIPAYMAQMDIFAAASDYESFGVALVEAMACGLPAVATDAQGFLEVAEDGVTALIVPHADAPRMADALYRLATDAPLRERMGKAARARAEQLYDWERSVDTLEQVYREVIRRCQTAKRAW